MVKKITERQFYNALELVANYKKQQEADIMKALFPSPEDIIDEEGDNNNESKKHAERVKQWRINHGFKQP